LENLVGLTCEQACKRDFELSVIMRE